MEIALTKHHTAAYVHVTLLSLIWTDYAFSHDTVLPGMVSWY
jgi:hypothetical protein